MATRVKQAIKGSVTGIIQNILAMLFQLIVAPMILVHTGQEALGGYAIIMQIIGYGMLLDFGFNVAFTRYLCQNFDSKSQTHRFYDIFSVGRTILLIINVMVFLALSIASIYVNLFIKGSEEIYAQSRLALLLMAVWMIAKTPLYIYNSGLTATQDMAIVNVLGIVANLAKLFLGVALTYLGYGIVGLISAAVVGEAIQYLAQRIVFHKKYTMERLCWFRVDWKLGKEMFLFGCHYWGVNLSVVFLLGSDNLIAGAIFGAAAASMYYSTKMFGSLIIQFLSRIIDNIYPAMNEIVGRGDIDAARSAYLRALRYVLLMLIPSVIGVAVFTGDLVALWIGKKQYAGNIMAAILALYVLIQTLCHLHGISTLAIGKIEHWSMISIICGLSSVTLAYVAGKILGMQWIMAGIVLSMSPILFFLAYRVISFLSIKKADVKKSVFPVFLANLPAIPLVVVLLTVPMQQSVISLAVSVVAYASAMMAGIWFFGINSSEKSLMLNYSYRLFRLT